MPALRGVLCRGRWEDAWPRIWLKVGRQVRERRRQEARAKQAVTDAHPYKILSHIPIFL